MCEYNFITDICYLLGKIAPNLYLKTKSTFLKKSEGSNYSLCSEMEVSHMDLE